MKAKTIVGISLGFCIIASSDFAWTADNGQELIDEFIRDAGDIINAWESKAFFALFITIAVAIFGLVSGALQKFDTSWTKLVTAACGIFIGGLTVINNTIFEHDHRQFKSMASEAQDLMADIKLIRTQYGRADADNQRSMLEDVRSKFRRIRQLEQRQSVRHASSSFVALAYAGGLPKWATQIPSDKDNYYFVGISDSRSYEAAKQGSKKNALDEATSYLVSLFGKSSQQVQVDNEALSNYIVSSAQVRETHFEYDSRTATYRFYTLVRLNKQIASTDLRLFSVGKGTPVPAVYNQTLQQTQRDPKDYLARRLDSWTNSLDTARQSLSPDQYAKFIKARELRTKNQYDDAIALLSDITRDKADFYLGWYNLARNYEDTKNLTAAQRAYDNAVRLEPQQPARDAALYNSYGYFLYRQKNYAESIRYLKRALEIDPDHPSASKTLEAAQKAAR